MNFLKNIATVAHTVIFLVIGGVLILLSLNLFTPDEVVTTVNYVYADPNIKLVSGFLGLALVLTGLLIAHLSLSRMRMEKTIAFENPEGQVTVSLSAVEDFIKKSVHNLSEVNDLRSNVTASKKGINIVCRATILANTNIPEITERIQSLVKSKVQDMLGVEEAINIKIHVTKISVKGKGIAAPKEKIQPEMSRHMPFAGGEQ